jgi:thiol-disulfide isomerase/thioredoxin
VKRSLVFILVIIVAITVALFVGKSFTKGSKGASGVIASVLKPQDDGPANGSPAPDFTLKTLDGKEVSLSSMKGKAVMVNFWATWCEPCKIEMPWLVEFNKQYGPQGFTVLGVAMDDDADNKEWVQKDIRKFADDMKVNYPVMLGNGKVGDTYGGVPFLPEIFYIGRDGKIVDHAVGLHGKGEIEDDIKKTL